MTPSTIPMSNASTRSGIRKLENGESIIPASIRADGSVRKEIRVKAGYRPPEDVEVYKNRTAEAWKSRGKGGVPGAEAVDESVSPHKAAGASAAAAKNAKRREARKKAATVSGGENTSVGNENREQAQESEVIDPQAEKAKEARKLAKKLRQARDLKDKKEDGGSLLPEQIAKVIKINELVRQLDNLGFDENGDEKAND